MNDIDLNSNIPEENPKSSPPHRKKIVVVLISVLCLLIILGGIALALVWTWKQYQSTLERANHLQQQVWEEKSRAYLVDINDSKQKLAEQQKLFYAAKQNLHQCELENEKNAIDWILPEANYLITLAAVNLKFEANPRMASQLLALADQQLQARNDPIIWPIRQALSKDIAALNAVPPSDLPGLLFRLNAWSHQIEQLPRIPTQGPHVSSRPIPLKSETSWVEKAHEMVNGLGQALRSLFVIHYDTQPTILPLLPPDQYIYVVANIQSQLALAQWSALHQQPGLYEQSLGQAITWIRRYFIASDAMTKEVLMGLQNLQSVSVKPVVPSIDNSVKAVKEAMEKRGMAS